MSRKPTGKKRKKRSTFKRTRNNTLVRDDRFRHNRDPRRSYLDGFMRRLGRME